MSIKFPAHSNGQFCHNWLGNVQKINQKKKRTGEQRPGKDRKEARVYPVQQGKKENIQNENNEMTDRKSDEKKGKEKYQ